MSVTNRLRRIEKILDETISRCEKQLENPEYKVTPAFLREVAALSRSAGIQLVDRETRTSLALQNDPILRSLQNVNVDDLLEGFDVSTADKAN